MKHIDFPKKCQNHWTLAYKYQKKNLIKLSKHSVFQHDRGLIVDTDACFASRKKITSVFTFATDTAQMGVGG
jgi:hypothetical protein